MIPFAKNTFFVEPAQIVTTTLEQNLSIQVIRGKIWLTIEGDLKDYWLHAGDEMELMAGKQIVIEKHSENTIIRCEYQTAHNLNESSVPKALKHLAWQTKRSLAGIFSFT